MATLSKADLMAGAKVREEYLPIPECGEGQGVIVRGYTVGDQSNIAFMPDGRQRDVGQVRLLSFLACCKEPKFTLEDTAFIEENMSAGVLDRVLLKADELSLRTVDIYEDLKECMRRNPLIRRMFVVCIEKLGRMPSELDHITQAEFMVGLAALEADGEVEAAKVETTEEPEE